MKQAKKTTSHSTKHEASVQGFEPLTMLNRDRTRLSDEEKSYKQKMEEIATKMADYFHANITLQELRDYTADANYDIHEWNKKAGSVTNTDAPAFLHGIYYLIICPLVEVTNEKDMLQTLKERLYEAFEMNEYNGSKEVLADISMAFMSQFSDTISDEKSINKFMKVQVALMALCEMYYWYEFYKNEAFKEKNQKAA